MPRLMMALTAALAAMMLALPALGWSPYCSDRAAFGGRHPNGGGFVSSSSQVASTAYIGPEAEVCNAGRVSGNAVIKGRSSIIGPAHVSGNARVIDSTVGNSGEVSGNAVIRDSKISAQAPGGVFDNARVIGSIVWGGHISGHARILNNARIEGNAEISGTAVVRNGARVLSGGKADCGRWSGEWIRLVTDQRGKCKERKRRGASDAGTTGPDTGTGDDPTLLDSMLSNPIIPGNTLSQ